MSSLRNRADANETKSIEMNISEIVDPATIEVDGIDYQDAPDFCDAFISYAETVDGRELTDDELNTLNEDSDTVYEAVIRWIH